MVGPEKASVLGVPVDAISFAGAQDRLLAWGGHARESRYAVLYLVKSALGIDLSLSWFAQFQAVRQPNNTGVAYEPQSTERRGRVGDIAGVGCGFAQASLLHKFVSGHLVGQRDKLGLDSN